MLINNTARRKCIPNDVWRILEGSGSMLLGEMRPSKDTSMPFPGGLLKTKKLKCPQNPVQHQASFDEVFLNNYYWKRLDI